MLYFDCGWSSSKIPLCLKCKSYSDTCVLPETSSFSASVSPPLKKITYMLSLLLFFFKSVIEKTTKHAHKYQKNNKSHKSVKPETHHMDKSFRMASPHKT